MAHAWLSEACTRKVPAHGWLQPRKFNPASAPISWPLSRAFGFHKQFTHQGSHVRTVRTLRSSAGRRLSSLATHVSELSPWASFLIFLLVLQAASAQPHVELPKTWLSCFFSKDHTPAKKRVRLPYRFHCMGSGEDWIWPTTSQLLPDALLSSKAPCKGAWGGN